VFFVWFIVEAAVLLEALRQECPQLDQRGHAFLSLVWPQALFVRRELHVDLGIRARWWTHSRCTTVWRASEYTHLRRSPKHFQLDSAKIKRAQKALHAKTETEAIERALDFAIAEDEKNRLVLQSTERFIKSGIEIKDVYGTLVD
jgi:hypothetical protein